MPPKQSNVRITRLIGHPPIYEEGKWEMYTERLEIFFKIHQIEPAKKGWLLLNGVDSNMYQLISNSISPKKPSETTFEEIVKAVNEYLKLKPNKIVERFKFNNARQKEREKITEYIARLKDLAATCEFGEELNDRLRDALVTGMRDENTKIKLLEEGSSELDFNRTIEIILNMELMKQDMAQAQYVATKSQTETNYPPYVLHESRLSRIWFKQSNERLLQSQEVHIQIELLSPMACLDPEKYNFTRLFVRLLEEALEQQFASSATLVHFNWYIIGTNRGLWLSFYGNNNAELPILLNEVVNKITNFRVDSKHYKIIKENYIRKLKNFEVSQPHSQAFYYSTYFLTEHEWSKRELMNATDALDEEKFKTFMFNFFSQIYMQGLIHGNCDTEKAKEIINIFESPFKSCVGLSAQLILRRRKIRIDCGNHLYEITNKYHNNSGLCIYYQFGTESAFNDAVIALLLQILEEQFQNVLRAQEKVGPLVYSNLYRDGFLGMMFSIQSEKPPAFLDGRVEAFLTSMDPYIENMSHEEFETHKTTLEKRKLQKHNPQTMEELTENYWGEISSRAYDFDRYEMEVNYLRTLTKYDILRSYRESLKGGSSSRRKLAVHVIAGLSQNTKSETSQNIRSEEVNKIKDTLLFKNSMKLGPVLKSHVDIPPLGNRFSNCE